MQIIVSPNSSENKFQYPRKRSNLTVLSNTNKKQCETVATNRNAALEIEELSQIQTPEENNQETNVKISPIFLKGANNYKQVLTDINSLIKAKEFTTKQMGNNTIKINVYTIDDYRKLSSFYDAHQVQFFTFNVPNNSIQSVIIRSVSIPLSEEDIKTELNQFDVIKVVRLSNKDKKNLCLYV